jgi:hypothetical protein
LYGLLRVWSHRCPFVGHVGGDLLEERRAGVFNLFVFVVEIRLECVHHALVLSLQELMFHGQRPQFLVFVCEKSAQFIDDHGSETGSRFLEGLFEGPQVVPQ